MLHGGDDGGDDLRRVIVVGLVLFPFFLAVTAQCVLSWRADRRGQSHTLAKCSTQLIVSTRFVLFKSTRLSSVLNQSRRLSRKLNCISRPSSAGTLRRADD